MNIFSMSRMQTKGNRWQHPYSVTTSNYINKCSIPGNNLNSSATIITMNYSHLLLTSHRTKDFQEMNSWLEVGTSCMLLPNNFHLINKWTGLEALFSWPYFIECSMSFLHWDMWFCTTSLKLHIKTYFYLHAIQFSCTLPIFCFTFCKFC